MKRLANYPEPVRFQTEIGTDLMGVNRSGWLQALGLRAAELAQVQNSPKEPGGVLLWGAGYRRSAI
jgi:hypothetical protein